jgi:hypothetical protein
MCCILQCAENKPSSVIIRVERVPEFHSVELSVAVVLMATGCVCR